MSNLDGIAIIGLAGRFPGASTVEAFWHNLCQGVESIQTFSEAELLAAGVDPQVLAQPNYVKAGAPLEQIEYFDAAFFGFNPREAAVMDPQQRLFLECAWEAVERAGYNSATYGGRIGTFAGIGWGSYFLNHIAANPDLLASMTGYQTLLGNEKDFISTRTAYLLNLTGPSITVQTACSTSLVATHLACHSLLSYQCDMALAGGAAIALPQAGYLYESGGILSPDGHCRAFDAQAQGTVAGSGVGLVVLKRLEDALAEGDQIYGVIKGSAVNNDGALKVGFTAPSVTGQAEAIAEALAFAEIEPDTIQYVETHGTGTALGDPIEITALTQVFQTQTERQQFCAIGSVKTNVGHLDTAAGVTSLIKTTLALHHGQIPPSLHFEQPNPQIDFAHSPFYVNAQLQEWPQTETPRRAGVSSFGMGGTNAHLVLEAAPARQSSGPSRPWQLLLLSGKTPTALEQATQNLAQHLQQSEANLADVAYTLQVGRQEFEHRRMVVCQTPEAAIAALQAPTAPPVLTHHQPDVSRSVAFLFPGQGSQYVNMGRELYESEPIFQTWIDRCATILQPHLGLDLRSLLYPAPGEEATATQQLQQTAIAQPALFTIEYALAQLWMHWGLEPDALIGHSIGEYVAACLAGVFSLEDALMVVAHRGRLMQSLPSGAMLAVSLAAEAVTPWLSAEVTLAAINAPQLCVVAGSETAIQALQAQLERQSIGCQRLHTSHAFHSPMMEPILQPFQQLVAQVQRHTPQKRWISNVTGTWITPAEATDPHYWAQHLRQPVRFAEGLTVLLQEPNRVFLEVGPGRTLSTLARQFPAAEGQVVLSSLRHPKDAQSDEMFLLNMVGRLWLAGITIDWSQFYSHEQRQRVCLPTYPFERQRYWIEPAKAGTAHSAFSVASGTPEKAPLDQWFYTPTWKQQPLVTAPLAEKQPSTWLVFCDQGNVGTQLIQQLQQQGQRVIAVQAGTGFSRTDETYTLNPQRAEDYSLLLQDLQAQQLNPDQIVHAWSLTADSSQSLEEIQAQGFYSLLFLAQALAEQNCSAPLTLQVLTQGLYSVTGAETLIPEQATILGPCQMIPQEYPHITCRVMDLENQVMLPKTCLQELLQPSNEAAIETAIAYRGRYRWVQRYDGVRLPAEDALPDSLRPQGVYLITGGLGGIGLTLAKYLAETVQARLILLSRSGLPEREEWSRGDLSAKVQKTIQTVQELESLGAQVQVIAADVTDADSVRRAIAQAVAEFGTIHGVIHAAGVPGGGLIQLKTPDAAAQVLAPKLQGTRCLHQALQGIDLDFFVLCSSLTAIVSELGQVDYCAANAYLDAWAGAQSNLRAIAINWDTWQSVGMAVQTTVPDALQEQRQSNLALGVAPAEGVEVFQRVLQSQLPQVIVSTQDLEAAIAASRAQARQAVAALTTASAATTVQQPRSLASAYVAPRNPLEQELAEIWQELLGVQPVGIHDNFFELGGHSLLAVQTVSRLRDAFQIELPLRVLLTEAPTIAELATVVAQMQPQGEQTVEIPPRPADALVPLSFEQQRLYFFDQLVPDSPLYNMPLAIRLSGPLQIEVLEQSWQAIAQRHEILRTQFVSQAGQTVQVVQPKVNLALPVVDLQSLSGEEQAGALQQHIAETSRQAFEIHQAPLLRLKLVRLGAMEHVLICVLHHLIADGWSRGVLIQELGALYSAGVTGQTASLPELPIQYGDFALWQRQGQGQAFEQHLQYWQHQLAALPVLELPSDAPRPLTQSFQGAKQAVQLPLALLDDLKTLSQQEGTTLFMTLLAGFKALLSAYSGQTDIVVGTDIANRHRPEIEGLIGFFVNQLALRTEVSGDLSFRQLLQRVKDVTLAAYSHQEVPFEQLVATLNPERDLSRAPLFQTKLVLQNLPTPDWQLPGLSVEVLPDIDTGTTALDLFLSLTETAQGLSGSLEYNTDVFTAETIQRLLAHLQQLLTVTVAQPDQPLATLPLLTPDEQQQLQAWNQTEVAYPLDRCLHHWIEDQVERTPDAIAVVFGETQLTYDQLNQQANQLAHSLQQQGVKPDTLVGICVERSLEMVIGLLAILKAGGAYVPLDPSYPPERLSFMLQDAQVPILLTQQALLETLPPTTAQIFCLDSPISPTFPNFSTSPISSNFPTSLISSNSPTSRSAPLTTNLVYVIYTSGSTGKPKGAMNTHQGICNRLLWMQDAYGLTPQDRVLQKTPFSFDVSVWEFFWPLMTGATLVVAPPNAHKDSAELVRLITQHQITTLHFVPSMLRVFLNDPKVSNCQSLRRVICSGEALAVDLQNLFFQHLEAELHNLYGPTEAAVDVTAWACQPNWQERTVPIGRAIANTQIYILNAALQPVPVGVAGELHIGGVGVGRGYWNRPELTTEKFIPNPFSDKGDGLYKTGDLARYRPDGAVEYLGRLDHQVKLRGLRIELGEIEAVLTQHPGVQAAVVIAREDQAGQAQLVAYWVPSQTPAPEVTELRSHLLGSLPDYMVPAQLICLEALPTLPNGKLDRRALPAPTWEAKGETFVAPRTTVEQRLCEIWVKYLQCEQIGIHDNFFERGGHSLLATQVISEIRQGFEIELPLRCLFESPTVAGLAVQINQVLGTTSPRTSVPALQPVSRDQPLSLSFAQQRLWFLQQLEPEAPLYNGAALVRLQGTLHPTALAQSLQEVVQRHETLRTRFVMVEGELVQQIEPQMAVPLPVVDLSAVAEPVQSQQVQALALEAAQHPFDLTTGPLFRASLLRLSTSEHCLLLNLHHIVSDGWSIGVLVRELAALYPAFVQGHASPLPSLPLQYADYALWQRQWLQGEVLQTQLDYWKQQLSNLPPALVFPTEATAGTRTLADPNAGGKHPFTFSRELTTALKQMSQQHHATLFMTLLAGFNLLLFDLTGTPDLLVGSPIANRNRPEIEDLIGFFVNTLVLRTDLSGDPSFAELLQQVRQVALGAYAHQDLPFEQLVSELQPDRTLTQAPFFRTWFVLQNAPMPPLELPDLTLNVTDLDTGLVRHDLKLDLTETGDRLSGFFEYKTAVFDADAIARLQARFEQLLLQITAHPDLSLRQVRERLDQAQANAFQASQRQRLGRLNRRPAPSL